MEKWIQDFVNKYYNQYSKSNNSPNVFNQKEFSKFIFDQLQQTSPDFKQMNHNEGNTYDGVLQEKPSSITEGNNSVNMDMQSNVFETHDYVIVRIANQNENGFLGIQLLVNCHMLFLQEKERNQSIINIKLPHPVHPKTTKYLIKNSILEIQIRKKTPDPWAVFDITDRQSYF